MNRVCLINPPSPFLMDQKVFVSIGILRVATSLIDNAYDAFVLDLAGVINEIDYFDLFLSVNKSNKVSLNLYSLVLDWLFILGVIKKGNKGLIIKCF